MVQMKGVEPPRLSALDPKSSASANFATSAGSVFLWYKNGADDGTWTHTSCCPLPPQDSASAIPPHLPVFYHMYYSIFIACNSQGKYSRKRENFRGPQSRFKGSEKPLQRLEYDPQSLSSPIQGISSEDHLFFYSWVHWSFLWQWYHFLINMTWDLNLSAIT